MLKFGNFGLKQLLAFALLNVYILREVQLFAQSLDFILKFDICFACTLKLLAQIGHFFLFEFIWFSLGLVDLLDLS